MLLSMPHRFSYCSENIGTLAATTFGVSFTAGGNNVDGTAVSMLSALAHDVHLLVIAISGINTAAADANAALDVLTDPAGGTSWGSFIADLCCGMTPTPSATVGLCTFYNFPVFIKSGTSVGIRCKTAHTADITSGRAAIWAYGNPNRPSQYWCGRGVDSIGISDSKGTAVTPGTSGSFGSWTSVGTATARRYGALQMGINGTDSNALANGWQWQMGIGSAQMPGTGSILKAMATSEQGAQVGQHCYPVDIAAGTQLQARAAVSSASGEDGYCAFYGVY